MKLTRRRFLASSSGGLIASTAALTWSLPHRVLGANERVNIGLIGAGGRGTHVAGGFAPRSDATIAAVCDLNAGRLAARSTYLATLQGGRMPMGVAEMRRVLDSRDVDAVIIATPDHWHSPATILACQAEKDVYVEKPPSHNIWEGRKMVQAAAKYKCVVQVGTQNRSSSYCKSARDYVASGKLGDIHLVKVFNLKAGGPFRLGPDGDPPANFDWNTWLGPARQRPYNSTIFNGGWHQFWDYSGGDFADDGIHQTDLAMFILGDPPMPTAVAASGGRLHHRDDAETPDMQVVSYDFKGFVMTFELTQYPPYMDKIAGDIRAGDGFPYWPQCATRIEFYGSKGLMYVGRHGGGWQVFGRAKQQSRQGEIIAQESGRPGDGPHQQNFIDCVKSRKAANADPSLVHRSTSLVHMGNIALRVGNQKLRFDADTERFDHEAANRLVKREYRKGFEVPEDI